jgi:hypothetical protein
LNNLLNKSTKEDFEELRFWGRVQCIKGDNDYYIAIGLTYNGKYEFPYKRFYYASGANFEFVPFPEINSQHGDMYDKLTGGFTGKPDHIYHKVVEEV